MHKLWQCLYLKWPCHEALTKIDNKCKIQIAEHSRTGLMCISDSSELIYYGSTGSSHEKLAFLKKKSNETYSSHMTGYSMSRVHRCLHRHWYWILSILFDWQKCSDILSDNRTVSQREIIFQREFISTAVRNRKISLWPAVLWGSVGLASWAIGKPGGSSWLLDGLWRQVT